MLQCVVPATNYEGVGLSMRTFAALRMRPGGGYGECGDIRLFFHRFKNTHLLLSVSRTKAVGKDGGTASGKGTCPCSGRCIVVMTARLPRAGNGGDARSIA